MNTDRRKPNAQQTSYKNPVRCVLRLRPEVDEARVEPGKFSGIRGIFSPLAPRSTSALPFAEPIGVSLAGSIPGDAPFDTTDRTLLYYFRNRMARTKNDQDLIDADRDLYSGLIRLHVMHHASEEPIFGLGMMEELARHGYRISPGSLYPLLHGLEKKGYLASREQRNGKSLRKLYRATPLGKKALKAARSKVLELLRELIEGK